MTQIFNGGSRAVPIMVLALLLCLSPLAVSAETGDPCTDQIVPIIQRHSFPPDEFAPLFGCAKDPSAGWFSIAISSTQYDADTAQLSPAARVIVSQIDRMFSDPEFSSPFTFDRTTSTILYPSTSGSRSREYVGDYSAHSDASNYVSNVQGEYERGVVGYLAARQSTNRELIYYLNWFIDNRDLAIYSISGDFNPLAVVGFQSVWGYNSIPWPWLMSSQHALAAYAGNTAMAVVTPTVDVTPTPTEEVTAAAPTHSGSIFSDMGLTTTSSEIVTIRINAAIPQPNSGYALGIWMSPTFVYTGTVNCGSVSRCVVGHTQYGSRVASVYLVYPEGSSTVLTFGIQFDPAEIPTYPQVFEIHAGIFLNTSTPYQSTPDVSDTMFVTLTGR